MTQFGFDFGHEERAKEHEKRFFRAVGAALDEVTQTRFCEFTGAKESDVSQARNGKRVWQQRWTDALLSMPDLPDKFKAAIVDAIAARAGLKATKWQPRTVREIADAAIAQIRRFGEMGADIADQLEAELAAAIAEGRR